MTVMPRLASRGLSSVRSWLATEASVCRTCSINRNSGLSCGTRSGSRICARPRDGDAEKLLGRMVDQAKPVFLVDHDDRHRQGAEHGGIVGRTRPAAAGQQAHGTGKNGTHAASRASSPMSTEGSMGTAERDTPRSISGS